MSLFIGRLHPDTNDKDLEELFRDFGSLTRCEVKRGKGYGFIEYKDKRDGEDAMKDLQGKTILGNRIVIEWARGGKRQRGETRSDSNSCFVCGESGHWARDCPDADDRDRKRRRSRSRSRDRRDRRRSRSRSRSRSPRDRRERSRRSRDRRSRSKSPKERRERERDRSASPDRRERSKSPVSSKGNSNADRSPSPKRKSRSPSPKSKSP